jgi:hypothetical protein
MLKRRNFKRHNRLLANEIETNGFKIKALYLDREFFTV